MLKVLVTKEVAKTLRVSQEHVRDLIRRGEMNAYKEGRRGGYRVTEEEVERYVRERFEKFYAKQQKEADKKEEQKI